MRKTYLIPLLICASLAGCGGSDEEGSEAQTKTVAACSDELPSLSPDPVGTLEGYSGSYYEGPLFETSLQLGDGGDNSPSAETLVALMNQHNVVRAMAMFGLDADDDSDQDVEGDQGLGFIRTIVNAAPCRISPFFVRGSGEKNSLDTENLNTVLTTTKNKFGTQIMRGIGELEIYKESWGLLDANDSQLTAVYDIAKENDLNIFSHWAGGPDRLGPDVGLPQRTTSIQASLEATLKAYPDVNFIFHLFPTDIETAVFNLMDTYSNFYFSVDLSHFLQRTPWQCGLLECFSENADPVSAFVQEFDANVQKMLNQAVDRYKPLIEAHPNQFLWGTENVELYDFNASVYGRAITFTRAFIAQLEPSVREKFAYRNAEGLFGAGVGDITEAPAAAIIVP